MNIIPLCCEIDDCFLALEKQRRLRQPPEMLTHRKNGGTAKPSYQRGNDDSRCFSSKSLSDVEAFLPKARLFLFALGVSKTRQL